MASKGFVLIVGAVGIGAVALLAKKASGGSSAAAVTPKPTTKVDQTIAKAKAAVTPSKGGKVDKAKAYVAKGTAEAQSAIDAVTNLLK